MSMISEQIKRLRKAAELFKKSGFAADGITWELEQAAKTIEELSIKLHNSQMERSIQYYNGGWIPCSDRLPEKPSYYLTTVMVGTYQVRTMWYDERGCWSNWGEKFRVLAWMPLPEKYKEREDGND